MAEEHGCQSPEGHRLCVNNCGFFGSPATGNMCSQCYRDVGPKSSNSTLLSPKSTPSLIPSSSTVSAVQSIVVEVDSSPAVEEVAVVAVAPTTTAAANRCSTCRKKVGLTGFRCKCGTTFCGTHRYPEKHGCTFDFKAVGREAIAKANPLVKGQKLTKI